jgi:hypothetical protein
LFSKIALEAGEAFAPQAATPDVLQATVLRMRGDWR